jgi:signal transduction histidine kinase
MGCREEMLENERSSALLDLTRSVGQKDWSASIRYIVQFDAESLPVARASFWSFSAESSSLHCEAAYVASNRMFERGAVVYQAAQPEYFAAVRRARALAVEEVEADPRTKGLAEYFASRGVTAMLDVPVWVEGRLAGVLCHEHIGGPRRWSPGDRDFAVGVGQAVSSALTARAHTRAEAAAARAEFLGEVSHVVGGSLDVDQVAQRVVRAVVPKLADVAMVWMPNLDNVLRCIAYAHAFQGDETSAVDAALNAAFSAQPGEDHPFAEKVIRQCQSLLFDYIAPSVLRELKSSPSHRALMEAIEIRAAIGVPLTVAGNAFGALVLFGSRRQYGESDLGLAEDIAIRVAAAMENARHYAAAREAIRARDDFLVLASHELRTPLASLQLHADVVRRHGQRVGDEVIAARGDAISKQVGRLAALVDHMGEALRIRSEGVRLELETFDLGPLVERCARNVAQQAGSSNTIKFRAEESAVGRWDPRRVEQAVAALIGNAIKFGAGKSIDVGVRKEGREAVIIVRDYGKGIAADRLSAIFSPFERAVPRENYGGLGLGLYIARAIVEAHGGTIAAKSAAGEGAIFEVRLPIASDG